MTIAIPATPAPRKFGIDLSKPVLYGFAAVLCVLIVLPLSWLVLYSLTDAQGHLTLANFYRLFTESSFYDPLATTFIIATSSAIICFTSGVIAGEPPEVGGGSPAASPASWCAAKAACRLAEIM